MTRRALSIMIIQPVIMGNRSAVLQSTRQPAAAARFELSHFLSHCVKVTSVSESRALSSIRTLDIQCDCLIACC
jgi:hypothetical protein